ncbi:MAG: NADH-quinone oxidoreductase subunit NuoG [Sphingomonadales bacterium]
MPTLTIDGREVTVEPGTTVLQACEELGIEIPRFCYHERLSISGNCRMCLVEMEKAPKLIASCSMPAGDNMVIHTSSPRVKKAREGVMEFMLVNHPLDCPVCDQGGECDLQDQSVAYGGADSRFAESKRAVKEKYMGPLIKTVMTRCILCTRCVRFATEIAGVDQMGALGRGESTEITTYLEQSLNSEMSGNVIDLCPVGALTSRPYAFTARPWELKRTESIDVHDAVGSNIRVDSRGREVMRVLPRLHEDVNEEWISDKTRFACDGLTKARLDRPYVRFRGKLREATWEEAFQAIAKRVKKLKGKQIAAIAGDLVDVEAMFALKELFGNLGSPNIDCRQDGAALDASERAGYLFNTTIAGIADADACLIIGANPRHEAPIINVRLRGRWLSGGFPVGVIGSQADLTYDYDYLGAGPQTLAEILDGGHSFAKILEKAERPMLILGQGALAREDGAAVLGAARAVAEKFGMIQDNWNGFNVLHTAAARVGGLDLGFVPADGGEDVGGILDGAESGDVGLVYLLGADEIDAERLKKAFVIYQGSHGDAGVKHADVILPGAAYTEKNALWVNTEGRVQEGLRAVHPPGDAREDWTVIRALSEVLGHKLPFDSREGLHRLMIEQHPTFGAIDTVERTGWGAFGGGEELTDGAFEPAVSDFHRTNPIARASQTMTECGATASRAQGATGTDG